MHGFSYSYLCHSLCLLLSLSLQLILTQCTYDCQHDAHMCMCVSQCIKCVRAHVYVLHCVCECCIWECGIYMYIYKYIYIYIGIIVEGISPLGRGSPQLVHNKACIGLIRQYSKIIVDSQKSEEEKQFEAEVYIIINLHISTHYICSCCFGHAVIDIVFCIFLLVGQISMVFVFFFFFLLVLVCNGNVCANVDLMYNYTYIRVLHNSCNYRKKQKKKLQANKNLKYVCICSTNIVQHYYVFVFFF